MDACIVRSLTSAHILCSAVIVMIDEVFWIQVKAAWSKRCNVKMADKEAIRKDSPSKELIDEMSDFKL